MAERPAHDPDGRLFDDIYAQFRDKDPASVPWAHGRPHPMFVSWLEAEQARGVNRTGQSALVVGSGLGDDANALAELGWQVTAFDYSPRAIAWAKERFPASTVAWHVADVFALPDEWQHTFDLVVEIHTIQALPVTRRQDTIQAITDTVAAGGSLIVVALTRDARQPLRGRPWPLTDWELRSIERQGVVEVDHVFVPPAAAGQPGRIRATFRRQKSE